MPDEGNHAIREVTSACPRLRAGLRTHFQQRQGRPHYVIEDTLAAAFFSVGPAEYRFLQMLDGRVTIAQAVAKLAREGGTQALSETEAGSLVRSLADANLLETAGAGHADRVREEVDRRRSPKTWLKKGQGILFPKIPLGNPDRALERMKPWFGWVTSPWFFGLWLIAVAAGGWAVAAHWERFHQELMGLFEVENLVTLGMLYVAMKVVHEFFHAMVCKRFGGTVPEVGVVLFMLVTPLGYVNATSAARFPSKWQRIFVSAAGMYGELFVAGIAALIWSQLDPGVWSKALHQVVVISSVTTILFNANPLMRFDGYFILADWTETPNLYSKAQRGAWFWIRRVFLGAKAECHPLSEWERRKWIDIYGVASLLWRASVTIGLLALVAWKWSGLGLMLGLVVAVSMLSNSLQTVRTYLQRQARSEGVTRGRFFGRLAVTLGVLVLLGATLPIAPGVRVPGVVEWKEDGDIRVDCPGFVLDLLVRNGDPVTEGQLLARLENVDEESALARLRLDKQRSDLTAAAYLQAENVAAWQAETQRGEGLAKRLAEVESYVKTLELRAPFAGVVQGRGLDNLTGEFVDRGHLFCTVGREGGKRIKLAIPQKQIDAFLGNPDGLKPVSSTGEMHQAVSFYARSRFGLQTAELERVSPHASTHLPHFALAAPAGGPLAVRHKTNREEAVSSPVVEQTELSRDYELATPCFEASVNLDAETAAGLVPGAVVYVRLSGLRGRTLAGVLSSVFSDYLEEMRKQAKLP